MSFPLIHAPSCKKIMTCLAVLQMIFTFVIIVTYEHAEHATNAKNTKKSLNTDVHVSHSKSLRRVSTSRNVKDEFSKHILKTSSKQLTNQKRNSGHRVLSRKISNRKNSFHENSNVGSYLQYSGYKVPAPYNVSRAMSLMKLFLHFATEARLTAQELDLYKQVIYHFSEVCDQHQIVYFIAGGTLVGSVRHHGFIPWDDDFDVYIDVKDRSRVVKAFPNNVTMTEHGPLVLDRYDKRARWKVYLNVSGAIPAPRHTYKWPFVDVNFYMDEDYVKNSKRVVDWEFLIYMNRSELFPVQRRPFEGLRLWAPRCARLLMPRNTQFDCCPTKWLHRREMISRGYLVCIPCMLLHSMVPFVSSTQLNVSHWKETLVFNGRKLQEIVHSDCIS